MIQDEHHREEIDQLLLRMRSGGSEAIDVIIAHLRPYLRVLAEKQLRSMFRTKFDGSDVVQQTCLDVFRNIDPRKLQA